MLRHVTFSLIAAVLAVLPMLSRADDAQWEVIRVYTLAEGQSVAVAIPAEWQILEGGRILGSGAGLSFKDGSGVRIHVSDSELQRAAEHQRVLRPRDQAKVATVGTGSANQHPSIQAPKGYRGQEPVPGFGAGEFVDLEPLLMWRAREMKIETPAVRP